MRKRILSAILLASFITTGVFANETKTNDLKADYKSSSEMMNELKIKFPDVHDVLTDYFQSKTCQEDFTKKVKVDELKRFTMSYQYGVLVALNVQKTPIAKANYDTLINAYKVMNCGDGDAFSTYIGATSAMAVEMNNK